MHRLVITDNVDPWHNLALEEHLFDTRFEGVTLYLWQNRNTVVIGRNQNAWKECRVHLLESEGGRLARRSSGGGAVFHDLGNVNFTFILPRKDYDLARQFAVLQQAVAQFGIVTEVSGRNDIVLKDGGAKFSGNAFRFDADTALHHGTILIDANMDKLGRYLSPSTLKMQAKGIDSVRSRVCNLHDINSEITSRGMIDTIAEVFTNAYGTTQRIPESLLDTNAIGALTNRHASWDWRFGKSPRFDVSFSERFPWGEIEVLLHCRKGIVEDCTVFSDAMDATMPIRIASAIKDAPFSPDAIAERVHFTDGIPDAVKQEIADWLRDQSC